MSRTGTLRILIVASLAMIVPIAGCENPVRPKHTSHKAHDKAHYSPSSQPMVIVPALPESPGLREEETPLVYKDGGSGLWDTSPGNNVVMGNKGTLLRFRASIEKDITGTDSQRFGTIVSQTLGDPRSWTGTGQWRFQWVGPQDPCDFVVYLATPATRDRLCRSNYDRYTSCRMGDAIVINVARWVHGVPHYNAPITTYRQYVINHEVGHRLGKGHELCPGSGRLAPVMQQQTLGFHGCVANSWPIVNNSRYTGPPGEYNDSIPAR